MIDYKKLETLLAQHRWREADEETLRIIEVLLLKTKFGTRKVIHKEDFIQIPYLNLIEINRLWLTYSNGKFGFSVQARIVFSEECNQNWNKFYQIVGWTNRNFDLKNGIEIINNPDIPQGYLPTITSLNCEGAKAGQVFGGGFFKATAGAWVASLGSLLLPQFRDIGEISMASESFYKLFSVHTFEVAEIEKKNEEQEIRDNCKKCIQRVEIQYRGYLGGLHRHISGTRWPLTFLDKLLIITVFLILSIIFYFILSFFLSVLFERFLPSIVLKIFTIVVIILAVILEGERPIFALEGPTYSREYAEAVKQCVRQEDKEQQALRKRRLEKLKYFKSLSPHEINYSFIDQLSAGERLLLIQAVREQ